MRAKGANKAIVLVSGDELRSYLALDSIRRVQQLATDGVVVTAGRGKYDLKASVQGYVNELRKAKKTSGLTQKQEESLEIRNQRDRMQVAQEYGALVQKDAVVHELVPIVKVLQTGLRALPNTTARENMNICRQYAEAVQNGTANDQQITSEFRDRDLRIVDGLLQTMADTLKERYGIST